MQSGRHRRLWWLLAAALVAAAVGGVLGGRLARERPAAAPAAAGTAAAATGALGHGPLPSLAPPGHPGAGPDHLAGTVVDAAGTPVGQVTIAAALETGGGSGGGGGGSARSRDAGPVRSARAPPAVSAVSAADGSFTLEGLDSGPHRLRLSGAGIVPAEVRFVGVPGGPIHLVVSRRVEVAGRVVTGAGKAVRGVAGAEVHLVGEAGERTARTGPGGAFSFPDLGEGAFELYALAPAQAAPLLRTSRFGSGPFAPVVLALQPAVTVAGRVVDAATGDGIAGAAVRLVDDAGREPPRFATTGAGGGFEVASVLGGKWSAEARAAGYAAGQALRFRAGEAPLVVAISRGGIIAGEVVDGGGAPVAGAAVSVVAVGAAGRARQVVGGGAPASFAAAAAGAPVAGAGAGATPLATAAPLMPGQRFIPEGELGVLLGPIPYPPPEGASVRVAVPLPRAGAAGAADDIDRGIAAWPANTSPETGSKLVSDAGGRFRVVGLAPGRYRVIVTHRRYADAVSPRVALSAKSARHVRVVLHGGVTVTGRVRDDRGVPIAGAVVTTRAGARAFGLAPRSAVTAADGSYRLGPLGRTTALTARAPGYSTATAKVTIRRGHTKDREQNFVLRRADAALSGHVRDPDRFPLPGARVEIAGSSAAAGRGAVTDESGRFEIDGVPPGTYPLTIRHPRYPPARARASTGDSAELSVHYGGGVAAEIRDAGSSAGIAGAMVTARGPGGARASAVTGADGSAELAPLEPGFWTVRASAAGYVPRTRKLKVAPGDHDRRITRDVRIDLQRGATVAGTVRDGDGVRVAGAVVRVGQRSGRTDASGRFRLEDVSTGQIVIEAEHGDLHGSERLDLDPGDEVVTLDIRIRR